MHLARPAHGRWLPLGAIAVYATHTSVRLELAPVDTNNGRYDPGLLSCLPTSVQAICALGGYTGTISTTGRPCELG